jgi:hypothetical protein
MSAVKRAKEIAKDSAENVVMATGVGDGRALPFISNPL